MQSIDLLRDTLRKSRDRVLLRVEDMRDHALARCRAARASTLALLDTLDEGALDRQAAKVPDGWEATFGTWRLCLQYVSDHWYMHRAHLADARRTAGIERMWV